MNRQDDLDNDDLPKAGDNTVDTSIVKDHDTADGDSFADDDDVADGDEFFDFDDDIDGDTADAAEHGAAEPVVRKRRRRRRKPPVERKKLSQILTEMTRTLPGIGYRSTRSSRRWMGGPSGLSC